MKLFKAFHIGCHIAAPVPIAWLVYAAFYQLLGGDPQEKMLDELGKWGLIFILLSLTVTPIRILTGWTQLIRVRRMLGLYGAFYLLLHVFAYFALILQFSLAEFFDELIKRPYITVGMAGVVLLVPLVITSTKAAQRKLKKNWFKLHQSAYLVGLLGIIHFTWQSKSDLNEPLGYILWGACLLLVRLFREPLKNRLSWSRYNSLSR